MTTHTTPITPNTPQATIKKGAGSKARATASMFGLDELQRNERLARRVDSFRYTFEKVSRILSGQQVVVKMQHRDYLPAELEQVIGWTDGSTIFLNEPLVMRYLSAAGSHTGASMTLFRAIASLTGVVYHELSHVLYTPRSVDEPAKTIIDKARSNPLWFKAFNILEDQRIEMLFWSQYPSAGDYFQLIIADWVVQNQQDLPHCHPYTYGRKYLPLAFRKAARKEFIRMFNSNLHNGQGPVAASNKWGGGSRQATPIDAGLQQAQAFEKVIDAYLRINPYTDPTGALKLVEEFKDLLGTNGIVPIDLMTGNHNQAPGNKAVPFAKKNTGTKSRPVNSPAKNNQEGEDQVKDMLDDIAAEDDAAENAEQEAQDSNQDQPATPDAAPENTPDDTSPPADTDTAAPGEPAPSQGTPSPSTDGKADNKADSKSSSNTKPKPDMNKGSGKGVGKDRTATPMADSNVDADENPDTWDNNPDSDGDDEQITGQDIIDAAREMTDGLLGDDAFVKDVEDTISSANAAVSRKPGDSEMKQHTGVNRTVPGATLTSMRRGADVLRRIRADIEPMWQGGNRAGRIDIGAVQRNAHTMGSGSLEVFEEWTPGMDDEVSLEVAIAVDLSSSMSISVDGNWYGTGQSAGYGRATPAALPATNPDGSIITRLQVASEAVWSLKQMCDRSDIPCTAYGFGSTSSVLFKPRDKVSNDKFVHYQQAGSTNPIEAIKECRRILVGSPQANKVFVVVTDGQWGNDLDTERQIAAMGQDGYTTLLISIGEAGDDSHQCNMIARCDDATEMFPVIQKLVTQVIKDVVNNG
jgi:hypothetical protein